MTGVTHGADPDRLDGIGDQLRGQGDHVCSIGEGMSAAVSVLGQAWAGPDAEFLLARVQELRPATDHAGAALIAFAARLREEAAEQRDASGGPGGAPDGRGAPAALAGGTVDSGAAGARRFAGVGGPPLGEGASPLVNAVGATKTHEAGGGGGPSAIGDGRQTDGGQTRQSGSVSHSRERGEGLTVTDTRTVSTSDESVDAKGRSVQTTTVTGTVEGGAGVEKRMKGTGVSAEVVAGTEGSYSVTAPTTVDPATVNPMFPEDMPEGTSIRLDGRFYGGYGIESSFRGLIVDMGQTAGSGHFVEVAKGEGDLVTVMVGDEEFAAARNGLGFGTEDLNVKAGASNEVSGGSAREVTIDLSTPEGRAAYYSLVYGGQVPASGDPGVVDVADLTVVDVSKSLDVTGTAGDWTVGGNVLETSAGAVQRTHADGSVTLDWTREENGVQVGGTTNFDASGNRIAEESTYHLRVEGVDPQQANNFNQAARDSQTQVSTEQNVVLTYTHEDLQSMRSQAAETTAARINAHPGDYPNFTGEGTVTAEDVLEHVENDPDAVMDVTTGWTGEGTASILRAQSDQEIIRAMAAQGPLEYSQGISLDHRDATGELPPPTGDVKSHESAT